MLITQASLPVTYCRFLVFLVRILDWWLLRQVILSPTSLHMLHNALLSNLMLRSWSYSCTQYSMLTVPWIRRYLVSWRTLRHVNPTIFPSIVSILKRFTFMDWQAYLHLNLCWSQLVPLREWSSRWSPLPVCHTVVCVHLFQLQDTSELKIHRHANSKNSADNAMALVIAWNG